MLRDPEFGPLRLRAFGTYSVRVVDPARFLTEIVGTDGEFTTDEISFQIRNIIVSEFSRAIASSGIPALDMAANTAELGDILASQLAPVMAEYGLEIPRLDIENISLPPKVEEVLDKRTSMGIVGDLAQYQQFATAEAMTAAAANTGGAGGMDAGIGAGLGMAMAGQMAQGQMNPGPWGAVAQPRAVAPPPPPPMEKVWHIAENGATKGPFSKAAMGRMALSGGVLRSSMVWTPGQDGWKPADEIAELAQLFTVMPPPPPPSG
jgi:membrane protease subunit (stomatin/prohibitin family)